MSKYPSIDQFRHVIRNIRDTCSFKGTELPTIHYQGTVKLHGTNAGIRVYKDGRVEYLSRNRVLSSESDNAGFMNHFKDRNEITDLAKLMMGQEGFEHLTYYGEWVGPGIQKGVAISEIPQKTFFLFGVQDPNGFAVDPNTLNIEYVENDWFENSPDIYTIFQFKTFQKLIDFNKPEYIHNELAELTMEVEAECPVAKHFGISGIGEGIVWKPLDANWNDPKYWFKTKGDKHSVSKVHKIVEIDAEAIYNRDKLIEAICTENRLEQGIQVHKELGHSFEMRDIGLYLRWVFNDIIKEERDRIEASGFTQKELSKGISDVAKRHYIKAISTQEA